MTRRNTKSRSRGRGKPVDTTTMTSDDQLIRWLGGQSLHRGEKNDPRSECCPDFSCCKPELRAPVEERRAFFRGTPRERNTLLGVFLGRLIARECQGKNVHVTGREEP